MSMSYTLETASRADDPILAEHYRLHWTDQGVSDAEVASGWLDNFQAFLAEARSNSHFGAFIARRDATILGSACCQHAARVYPPFLARDAGDVGYIWGVYVVPAERGEGVGRDLIRACVHRLESQGCRRVLLHAGVRARPLYERLGFSPTDELAIDL